jgi:glyoxylase-like metal-dependent hydrolase (beta-lactamase superfamily II)
MRVYILQLGSLKLDSNGLCSFATSATRSNPRARHEFVDIPVWGALIDHPEGKILYDLGCRPDAMEGGWPESVQETMPFTATEDQRLENQLKLIGAAPEEIGTVVVSHMHNDHFGNIKLFAHADVYVPKEDWVNGLIYTHEKAGQNGDYSKEEFEVPVKAYHPVAIGEDFELASGVEVVTLPGHTENLLGLVVHLEKDGVLIFPSDALYTPTNYGPPVRLPGFCFDSRAMRTSVEKIRRIQKRYQAKIMYSHCYEEYDRFKKIPEYYE